MKNNKTIRIKTHELYYLVIGMWAFFEMLRHSLYIKSIPNFIFYGVDLFIILASGYRIIKQSFSKYSLLICFITSCISLITAYYSKSYSLFILIIILIGARDIEFKRIVKVLLISLGGCMLFVVLSCKLGILEDYIFYRYGVERHSLGFAYCYLSSYFLNWCMMFIYEKGKRIKKLHYIFIFFINQILYKLSNVRGPYYLLIVVLVFNYLFINRDKINLKKNIYKVIAVSIFPIGFFLSYGIAYIFNNSSDFWSNLDSLLTGRIRFMSQAIKLYGTSLLGSDINFVGNQYGVNKISNYVDCAYLQIGIKYGIIFILFLVIAYTIVSYISVKKRDVVLFVWLILIAIESIFYPNLISIVHNSVVMSLVIFFSNNPKKILKNTK